MLKKTLTGLTLENEQRAAGLDTCQVSQSNSPIRLSVRPENLQEAAMKTISERSLSPGKVAILPTDMKVELAHQLAIMSDAPLTARFEVEK